MSTRRSRTARAMACTCAAVFALPLAARAQLAPGSATDALPGVKIGGSPNLHLITHVPLGGFFRVMDNEIEQDPARPFAYLSQGRDRPGFTIMDLRDLNNIKVLYHWSVENASLHA